MSTNASPNIHVIPPGAQKFHVPPPPTFSKVDAILSAASLLLFVMTSLLAIKATLAWPWWVAAPFWFTALGSGIGLLYESWLLLRGRPYQLFVTKSGRRMQLLRAGTMALVFGSVYLAHALGTFDDSSSVTPLVGAAGLLTGFILVMFLLEGPPQAVVVALLVGLIGQLALVALSTTLHGNDVAKAVLALAACALFATTIIGAATPRRSTLLHVIGAVVVGLLWFGLRAALASRAASPPGESTIIRWLVLAAMIGAGAFAAFRLVPRTWGVLRSAAANATWPLFYLVIAGGMRIPRPNRLSELYRGQEGRLRPLSLLPYHLAHPRALTHAICVPSLDEALTVKVQALGFITRLVQFAFAVASLLNRVFPFADIAVPLAHKPRMLPWSDGAEYWPAWLLKSVHVPTLGQFSIESGVRGPGLQPTPERAVHAYQQGQLLAYLAEYGIAGSLLRVETRDGVNRLALDFSFLEQYETKSDYEPYGGAAWFVIDDAARCLRLTAIRAPRSNTVVEVDPSNATFRHAEDMVLASLYFLVVSGKHLLEIHMGLNLVEVALFNSFDAKLHWAHPVRLALYPHLFAHELAEELTTQNLLEDRAVFPQIFATTNAALMRHLNDRFSEYALGRDEDFDARERVLLAGHPGKSLEEVLPHSGLIWERQYFTIWHRYATSLIDAAYRSDGDVASDACVPALFANLSAVFEQPLPERYDQLRTKPGLARYIADTMHHLIIRHEVYGTTGVRLALDPRINKVQVPKDGGTYAVDEWRSLACVALATSRVRYVQLSVDFTPAFDDLEDATTRSRFHAAHHQMKRDLEQLETSFTTDGIDNYECLRPLPSELDIGAGY